MRSLAVTYAGWGWEHWNSFFDKGKRKSLQPSNDKRAKRAG